MSSPNYKALILDLDGTTIPMAGELPSDRVIQAVHKAQSKGAHVIIATGRIRQNAEQAIQALGITEPCIFYNGAQLYHMGERRMLRQHCIEAEDMERLLKIFKGETIEISAEEGKVKFVERPQDLHLDTMHIFGCYVPRLTQKKAERYMRALSSFPHLRGLFHTQTWDGLPVVGVTHINASKQEAIAHVVSYLHINPKEIVAIGDGENDMPMVIAAGMGVAMGNAAECLKDVADYIAPSVEEDGVAHVIEKFFFS